MKRKFKPVPKDKKSGIPKKYVKGSKDPDATRIASDRDWETI